MASWPHFGPLFESRSFEVINIMHVYADKAHHFNSNGSYQGLHYIGAKPNSLPWVNGALSVGVRVLVRERNKEEKTVRKITHQSFYSFYRAKGCHSYRDNIYSCDKKLGLQRYKNRSFSQSIKGSVLGR